MKRILSDLVIKHIKDTPPKSIVHDETVFLCQMTKVVMRQLKLEDGSIYINTKILKHLYDKKPAEEFDFIINNLHTIAKYPDCIYKNKGGKRGEICFTKKLKDKNYICSLEIDEQIFIVTAFRVRDEKYMKNYESLWSWEDDKSPS